ncbi:glycosyltransferase 87 family protein [Cellulomonas sp. NS3]|uniref:glycosyltransferase 87 family protein n=1 Tax=Cellulomonas sp. NS3 TaxID=2973977 RepID=UPI0021637B1A|nr:glycosyltransferase 87 family protein [Cellulomonas sp. NS3]
MSAPPHAVLDGRPDAAGPGSRWLAREWDRLREQRPGQHRALRRLWERPGLVLIPLAAVVCGLIGTSVPGGDPAWFARAGRSMLGAGFWDVFADPGLQIGPLYLLGTGVAVAGLDALALPRLFVLGAVQGAGLTWLTLRAVRTFTPGSALAARWAIGSAFVVGGLLAEAVGAGHPEDVLVALVLAHAAHAASRGARVRAGVLVGVAAALKLWGVLGVPVLLVRRRPGDVMLGGSAALLTVLVAYVPFVVWGEVNTFEFHWSVSPDSTLGLLGPGLEPPGWSLRLLQGGAVVLAGSLAASRRHGSVLGVVVVVVAVRLLLDPLRLTYYSGPLLVALLLWLWSSPTGLARRLRTPLTLATPLLVLGPYVVLGASGAVVSTVLLLAAPAAVLLSERRPRDQQALSS